MYQEKGEAPEGEGKSTNTSAWRHRRQQHNPDPPDNGWLSMAEHIKLMTMRMVNHQYISHHTTQIMLDPV